MEKKSKKEWVELEKYYRALSKQTLAKIIIQYAKEMEHRALEDWANAR